MDYVIKSEERAFALLQQALNGELANQNIASISFDGWPQLQIKLNGEGYDSTITPEVAQAIIEIQHALNRAYARVVHHHHRGQNLKSSEKDALRLKAKVEKGSTEITVDFGQAAEAIAQQVIGKMTPTDLLISVLGLAAIWGATSVAKHYFDKRSEDKAIDAESQKSIAMSVQETARFEVFAKAVANQPVLQLAGKDFDEARHEMVKAVADADFVTIQGVRMSNQSAKAIASNKRSESKEVQLNGEYVILSVDHSKEDEVRLMLSRTQDGFEFPARFKDLSLDQREVQKLKDAQWERTKVYLSINGTELRGVITSATVISVDIQPNKIN